MTEQEFSELSAAAALHALSPEDHRRYVEALDAHPEWRDVADEDASTTALLAEAAASVDPPASIRSDLLARIATTPQITSSADDDVSGAAVGAGVEAASGTEAGAGGSEALGSRAPRRPLRVLFALAACLALLVGVGFAAVAINDQLNPPAGVVALADIQAAGDAAQASVDLASGGTATAHWSGSLGTAVLVTDGIPALAEGETYELWFVRGDTPVSAGVFDVTGDETTTVLAGDMHAGDVIAVTVEQRGGSTTGLPTTDPVIAIPTA